MHFSAKALVLICSSLLTMQTANAADFSQAKDYPSATEQRGAIADCMYELGKRDWPLLQATYVERPWGGKTVIRILPHRNVKAEDAAWINACADTRLGRASRPLAPKPVNRPRGHCPRHASVLYGGTAYCVGS